MSLTIRKAHNETKTDIPNTIDRIILVCMLSESSMPLKRRDYTWKVAGQVFEGMSQRLVD